MTWRRDLSRRTQSGRGARTRKARGARRARGRRAGARAGWRGNGRRRLFSTPFCSSHKTHAAHNTPRARCAHAQKHTANCVVAPSPASSSHFLSAARSCALFFCAALFTVGCGPSAPRPSLHLPPPKTLFLFVCTHTTRHPPPRERRGDRASAPESDPIPLSFFFLFLLYSFLDLGDSSLGSRQRSLGNPTSSLE